MTTRRYEVVFMGKEDHYDDLSNQITNFGSKSTAEDFRFMQLLDKGEGNYQAVYEVTPKVVEANKIPSLNKLATPKLMSSAETFTAILHELHHELGDLVRPNVLRDLSTKIAERLNGDNR